MTSSYAKEDSLLNGSVNTESKKGLKIILCTKYQNKNQIKTYVQYYLCHLHNNIFMLLCIHLLDQLCIGHFRSSFSIHKMRVVLIYLFTCVIYRQTEKQTIFQAVHSWWVFGFVSSKVQYFSETFWTFIIFNKMKWKSVGKPSKYLSKQTIWS